MQLSRLSSRVLFRGREFQSRSTLKVSDVRSRWNKIVKRALSWSKAQRGGFYGEKPGEREGERERSEGADRVAGPVRCPGPCYVGTDLWPTDLRDKFYCKHSRMRIPSAQDQRQTISPFLTLSLLPSNGRWINSTPRPI